MIADGQNRDAMESYLSNGLKVPSTGVYGVSTFGRIDAFTPPTDSKNDVYLQVMVNSALAVTFYKAQYLDRESVGGTVFLWLKKDDVLSVSALLTDTVVGKSVVLDNVYLSVARIN